MPPDTLTKREQEIVLELLDGGRVNTIAAQFALSPRTVRNHIKSVFSKVNVHSQSELIELGRTDPERLNLTSALNSRSQLAFDDLNRRAEHALMRLKIRISEAYAAEPPALNQLRTAVRAALPLDAERSQDWQDFLELKTRLDERGEPASSIQQAVDEWRESFVEQIIRLQQAGAIRGDLNPNDVLSSIGAVSLGVGTRLLGNQSNEATERELRMLDTFVDALSDSAGE
ncbi:MAG: LuxR C-terminal-related transcriptional regulator [Myxococcales bacterium]|nr:LuxR family transcriptional regulator [Myxococcales bacterium]HIK86747.1 LuxR family transcriptional regulator [Myxococcales bacterium]